MSTSHPPTQDVLRFFAHAREEARRYGPDPWIFVRELMQNARDALATTVHFDIEASGDTWQLTCIDNGSGMSLAHAKRYLFALYASSKEEKDGQIGRFGVGFWSVLRFEPVMVCVSSCDNDQGDGWEIQLHEAANEASLLQRRGLPRGTRIVLARKRSGETLEQMQEWLRDAAWQNGRFLTCANDRQTSLPVFVSNRSVAQPFELASPAKNFETRGMRGVVALDASPGVELFFRGLRVRVANVLDDLLSSQTTPLRARVRFASLSDSLAVRVILDCDQLDLVLSRADARDTRELRHFVATAHKETQRLIEAELNAFLLPSWRDQWVVNWYRLQQWFDDLSNPARAVLGAISGAAIALLIYGTILRPLSISSAGSSVEVTATGEEADDELASVQSVLAATTDLDSTLRAFANYQGPSVDELSPLLAATPDIRYQPALEPPLFLRVRTVLDPSATQAPTPPPPARAHRFPSNCAPNSGCYIVQIQLPARSQDESYYLPVPTGQLAANLRMSSSTIAAELHKTGLGESVLQLAAGPALSLQYETFADSQPPLAPKTAKTSAHELVSQIRSLTRMRKGQAQLAAALRWVQQKVIYSTSAQTAQAHQAAIVGGESFVDRALAIGEGDCDVQNGLLVLVLRELGYDARLALGFVGRNGRVAGLAHAWVEIHQPGGKIEILDATAATLGFPIREAVGVAGQQTSDAGNPQGGVKQPEQGTVTTTTQLVAVVEQDPFTRSEYEPSQPAPTQGSAQLRPWLWAALTTCGTWLMLAGIRRRLARAKQRRASRGTPPTALLLAALHQGPHALRNHALLRRRLLEQLGRGALLSLREAQDLAREDRLYVGSTSGPLARALLAAGATVLDSRTALVQGLSQPLGAQSLEELEASLARAKATTLLAGVQSAFAAGKCGVWIGLRTETVTSPPLEVWAPALRNPLARLFCDIVVVIWRADDPRLQRAKLLEETDFFAAACSLVTAIAQDANLPEIVTWRAVRSLRGAQERSLVA